jgi:hypothetical protein
MSELVETFREVLAVCGLTQFNDTIEKYECCDRKEMNVDERDKDGECFEEYKSQTAYHYLK